MKKWSIFLAVLPMMILNILFNAWCLQCVYILSVIPILATFDVIAPVIPFSIFIMVKVFNKVNKKRVEEKVVEETNTEKYLKQITEILEKK